MDSRQFSIEFDEAVALSLNQAEAILNMGCNAMFNAIKERTPVDTGFARASWWESAGGAGNHPNPPVKAEKGGTVVSVPQLPVLAPLGESLFFSNNAEHIDKLEYGHSKQAPDGMVRVTLAEADVYFERAKNEVMAKGVN